VPPETVGDGRIEKWKLVGFQNREKLVGKLVKSIDKLFVTVLYF
jgi:hypothetical protein